MDAEKVSILPIILPEDDNIYDPLPVGARKIAPVIYKNGTFFENEKHWEPLNPEQKFGGPPTSFFEISIQITCVCY